MHKHMLVSVIIVIKHFNQFLLVQRKHNDDIFPGKWQNLGGKVEPEETVENAIIREVKEEVNITIPKSLQPDFLHSYSWKKEDKGPSRLGLIFLVTLSRKPKVIINDELNSYGWYTYKEMLQVDTIGKQSSTGTRAQIRWAIDRK